MASPTQINTNANAYNVASITGSNLYFGGITFSMFESIGVNFQDTITDYYVQDNTTVQDNIINTPQIITLSGMVSELSFIATNTSKNNGKKNKFLKYIEQYGAQLIASVALPGVLALRNSALNKANSENQERETLEKAMQSSPDALSGTTQQSRFYQYIMGLRTAKTLFKITSPYGNFPYPFAIQSMNIATNGNGLSASDITLTLKEIRFTTTQFEPIYSSKTEMQSSPTQNYGILGGN